jgi:hypothetical protein
MKSKIWIILLIGIGIYIYMTYFIKEGKEGNEGNKQKSYIKKLKDHEK